MSSKVLNLCVVSIYLNTSSKIEMFSSYEATTEPSSKIVLYDQALIR